jgi:hypothetical protein
MVVTRLQKNKRMDTMIQYLNNENKIDSRTRLLPNDIYNTTTMPGTRQTQNNRDNTSPTSVADVIKVEELRPGLDNLSDFQRNENHNDSDSENEQHYDSSTSDTSSTTYLKSARKKMNNIVPLVRPYITSIYQVSALYVFWIALHYVTAQLYVRYCATYTFYGFMVSPFLISSPHCVAMRWVFTKGGNLIEGMWTLLGTWLCSKIITRN